MRLSTQDASFLYSETASGPMHGTSIAVFEGEIPFDRIVESFESRLHLVPRYRQRLAFVPFNLAHAKWVDDPSFRLENHLVRESLPPGATLESATLRALELAEPLLDRRRPLWKTFILEGVPDRTLMVSLGHHAMVDGVSSVDLLTLLLDLAPDAKPPTASPQAWAPPSPPGSFSLLEEALLENAETWREQNPFAGQTPFAPGSGRGRAEREELLRRANDIVMRLATRPVIGAPWNAAPIGPKRKLAFSRYELADFRAIRNALGGTVNDVALAILSEAAARYLDFHGEDTHEQQLRLMCPVNVRREDEKGALGNRVSGMFPTLPAWRMEAVKRLQIVCEETQRLKANKEPQALELLMESAASVSPMAMAQTLLVGTPFDPTALLAQFPPPVPRYAIRPPHFGYNFVVTNVPGVQVPLYLGGHKLLDLFGAMMLAGNVGLGVAITSYERRLYFNLTSDARLLPDVERLRDLADEAFAELLEAAQAAGSERRP